MISRLALRCFMAIAVAGGWLAGAEARGFRDLARPALRSYAERDGLPHPTVQQIVRDPEGRLWAATQGGPAVFDGRRWRPVEMPPEAASRFVRTLLVDARGRLWLGTQDDGIWRMDLGSWTHLGPADGLPALRVNHLLEVPGPGGRSTLWAATSSGPARWDGRRWIPATGGLTNLWTWRLALTPRASGPPRLWACTRGGLARWEGQHWVLQPEFLGLEVNSLIQMAGTSSRDRWVGCFGRGLAHWTREGVSFLDRAAGHSLRFPSCLALTRTPGDDPVLWVGTYSDGLASLKDGHWSFLTPDRGLPSQAVYALQPDPQGKPALWIGMQGGGISALTPGEWMTLPSGPSGFPSPDTTAFAETREPDGPRIWFGTPRGLVWREGGRWHVAGRAQGLPSPSIKALALQGPRLVAATDAGLAVRQGPGWRRLDPAVPGIPRAILGTRAGTLWAATSRGLFRLQGGHWQAMEAQAGVPLDVLCLAETREAGGPSLWAGTRGQGLLRWRDGRWTRLDPMPRYPGNWITSLHAGQDARGRAELWVGTRGQGLAHLDPGDPKAPVQVYDARSKVPVPNTVVYSIVEDRAGSLYLGVSGGVERLTFRPDGTLVGVETFTSANGLPSDIVNPGAGLLDPQGRVWFGLPEGPAFLEPAGAASSRPLPPPVLERFLVDDRAVRPRPGLQFPHGTRHFAFTFFTPSFFRDEDLRYRTRLVGLEPKPGPWTFENTRDYGGLGPGSYALEVWARDYRGRISAPLRFPFVIRTSPWLHPVALGLYFLAAGLILVSIFRIRTRLLRKRNAWLQARVDAATEELSRSHQSLQVLADHLYRLNEEKSLFMGMAAHDLRNPLHGIRLRAELLAQHEDAAAQGAAQAICAAVDEVLRLLNRLLDLEAIETGRRGLQRQPVALDAVVQRACALHRGRARAKSLQLISEGADSSLMAQADLDTLAEVVDNLVTNAIKFSPQGRRIWLGAAQRDAEAVLWVRDEGPGFLPEDKAQVFKRFARLSARPTGGEPSTGLGLAIVKRLVEDMGGRIALESEPGQGAAFLVFLPLA